ncbi:hypothetical protein SynA1562_01022 [Synechococcus sp. A15-62]|nr:hypothetical protein SynA1562_01022 [Synechococcus sp. A15-62]
MHLGCVSNWVHRMGLDPFSGGANRSLGIGPHARGRLTGVSF